MQWLQLSCFTHGEAALIFSAFNWGNAFSNLMSGLLLNFTAMRFPDHGPPTLANFSVASGIPYLVLFFFVLPKPDELGQGGSQVLLYFVCFLMFGLGATMCGTINKKVLSDIVPSSIYTYFFSIDKLIETSIGNLAGIAVGILTDKAFHYDTDAIQAGGCNHVEAHKLALGMFTVCIFAWAICFTVYLGMHWTYPKDRRRQLPLSRDEAEKSAALRVGDVENVSPRLTESSATPRTSSSSQ